MNNCRYYLGMFCSMLVFFLCACESVQQLPAQTDDITLSHAIVNGTLDESFAHKAAVVLYFQRYGVKQNFCSATLITPQYVLTAAHCVGDLPGTPESERIEPLRPMMRVGIGNTIKSIEGSFEIAQFYVHERYGTNGVSHDIAILKLKDTVPNTLAVPIAPLPPSKAFNQSDLQTQIFRIQPVGYGRSDFDDPYASGVKYRTQATVAGVCGLPEALESERYCYNMGTLWGTFYYETPQGGTCFGDSGGPVFYVYDGLEYVAGVNSTIQGDCNNLNCATRVPDFYSFIESVVPGLPAKEKENCDNGVDDNNDNRVDCLDPYCMGLSKCIPEDCSNAKDDNGDNLVDCADMQCKDKIVCVPEICDNNIDENGDNLVDCDDPQCKEALRCQPEDCTNAEDDNGDTLVDCADPKCDRIIFCIKEHCSNGKDDNANKLIDCADPQCANDIACKIEDCSNNIDDNQNGRTDCEDTQCLEDPRCKPELCDNKIDDNFNTLVDCSDPQCASAIPCLPEVCDNQKDDNGDGNIDCDEEICKNDEHCTSKKTEQACSFHLNDRHKASLPLLTLMLGLIFYMRRVRIFLVKR